MDFRNGDSRSQLERNLTMELPGGQDIEAAAIIQIRQHASPGSFFISEANDIMETSNEAPLLPYKDEEFVEEGKASLESSVFNLSNTMIGAGLMSLPAAMKMLGLFPGILAMLLISFLSNASIMAMLRCTQVAQKDSFSKVVANALGWWGKLLLCLSIVVNNAGLLMVFFIIIGDVLCGSAGHPGLLPGWFGTWWIWSSRHFILAALAFALIPLVLLEKLDSLSFTSKLSVILSLVFVATTVGLALLKIAQGTAELPAFIGHNKGSAFAIFSILNVINNAFICQFNVMPIYRELRDPSQARMQVVVHCSLGCTTFLYIAVGVFGIVLFGDGVSNDVLQNFDGSLASLTEHAVLWATVVKFGYAASRALTFPLILFTLRILLLRGLAKVAGPSWGTRREGFYLVTALIMVVTYIGAVEIPDIWTVFLFMGATAAVLIGFILPGLVALNTEGAITTNRHRFEARALVAVGAVMGFIGIAVNIYSLIPRKTPGPSTVLGVDVVAALEGLGNRFRF